MQGASHINSNESSSLLIYPWPSNNLPTCYIVPRSFHSTLSLSRLHYISLLCPLPVCTRCIYVSFFCFSFVVLRARRLFIKSHSFLPQTKSRYGSIQQSLGASDQCKLLHWLGPLPVQTPTIYYITWDNKGTNVCNKWSWQREKNLDKLHWVRNY